MRAAGCNAGKSREEWLFKRDKIQYTGEPDNVRSTAGGIATNTAGGRLERPAARRGEGARDDALRSDRDGGEAEWTSTDTECSRGYDVDKHIQSQFADGAELISNGGQRDAADSGNAGLQGQDEPRCEERRQRVCVRGDFAGHDCEGLRPEERWAVFPTVSPVHRGNDGFPFDVDDLAISAGKWRTESLKAYGNAIVPQVMYRIFQAIEQVNQ